MPMMALKQLLLPWISEQNLPDIEISSLSNQSAESQENGLFFAYQNDLCDRAAYIEEAVANGAVAIALDANRVDYQKIQQTYADISFVEISDLAQHYGEIAARFYDNPTANMLVTGITGTNGKSSTAYFLAQALNHLHKSCAFIGTIGIGLPNQLTDSALTTLDPINFQKLAYEFKQEGVQALVIEMSSHALAQNRLQGLHVDTSVLTQITSDHLDYHKTLENYHLAKEKCMQLPGLQQAVLNIDDTVGQQWLNTYADKIKIFGYGTTLLEEPLLNKLQNYLWIEAVSLDDRGLTIHYNWQEEGFSVKVPIVGRFNVENISATIATLLAYNYTIGDIQQAVQTIHGAPGRMQYFGGDGLPSIYVDYAHTADGLEKALIAVKEHSSKHLITVFGCGGDRDKTKRAPMGALAADYSNAIVLTSDNPRSEDPAQILTDIEEGIIKQGFDLAQLRIIEDRAEAIRQTILQASSDDVLLIAGKGHERTQKLKDKTIECDDRAIVTQALADYKGAQ